MARKKIFISSVQIEFASERQALFDYILADPLLGKFFDPFLFEHLPALNQSAQEVFLHEVVSNDIYMGLLGREYGYEGLASGVSPTETEFDFATKHHKTRFIFLTNHAEEERHPKEIAFIKKVQELVVRKRFSTVEELKSGVYAALVRYLEDKEIIRVSPFDVSNHPNAGIEDIDEDKLKLFVRIARSRRGFSLSEEAGTEKILSHLNLIQHNKVSNAAILLFGKQPQRYFVNSEIRCVSYYKKIVSKPIQSYKVFKGSVFELVDQAVDFVLSKLDYAIGTREREIQIPGGYEIPKEIVAEAIVNAIAHRDYTSNGSVQVMLFPDRLEIWNPGSLPLGWTTEKLKQLHTSVPANPLLAEPMYLAGYIERLGTGTADMMRISAEYKLQEPRFIQDEDFRTILYRPDAFEDATVQASGEASGEASVQVPGEIQKVILVLNGEMKRSDIQKVLQLKHDDFFRTNYINPSLEDDYIEMTDPENPKNPNQQYRLTLKGIELLKKIGQSYSSRKIILATETVQVTDQATDQATDQVQSKLPLELSNISEEMKSILTVLKDEMNGQELQTALDLKHRGNFRNNYLSPALAAELIEMKYPGSPNHPRQKYSLSKKGKSFRKQILK